MKKARRSGFTLIEMIVVVAILVALAGILVPVVSSEMASSKTGKALADCNRVAGGLNQYIKDTAFFPTGNQGASTNHFLYGLGTLPGSNDFASGASASLDGFLSVNTNGGSNWKGPYMQSVKADPWGRAYVVNTHGYFNSAENVWVISAGPDGNVDTAQNATTPGGDDIGVLID